MTQLSTVTTAERGGKSDSGQRLVAPEKLKQVSKGATGAGGGKEGSATRDKVGCTRSKRIKEQFK